MAAVAEEIRVEVEHMPNELEAASIALDYLSEDFYSRMPDISNNNEYKELMKRAPWLKSR
jgi:hypothetical protein